MEVRDRTAGTDAGVSLSPMLFVSLLEGAPAQVAALLPHLAADPHAAWLLPFIRALQAIVSGRRDRTLADAPDLDHTMAAEILFLLETLARPRG
jgi:hypothetical protein